MGKYLNSLLTMGLFSLVWLLPIKNSMVSSLLPKENYVPEKSDELLKLKSVLRALDSAKSIKHWLKKQGYSTSVVFMADMNLSMYIKRFYVINVDSGILLNTFLVAHGSGLGSTSDSVVFSNKPGSLCSSKGKYKLGETMRGEYGKGYWLDGLDKTNNNARRRLVVFHYYLPQTTQEYSPGNYFSSGCPMIAKSSFDFCDSLIKQETKPVILYIYK